MTENFKGLSLDRSKILPKLYEFTSLVPSADENKCVINYTCYKDKKEFKISQFNLKDGLTTLSPIGNNIPLSKEAIRYLITECIANGDGKNIHISTTLSKNRNSFYSQISDYLNEYKCKTELMDGLNSKIMKVQSPQGDKVTLTLYENGTLLIQGKYIIAADLIFSFMSDYLSIEEVVKMKDCAIKEALLQINNIEKELQTEIGKNVYNVLDVLSRGWCKTSYLYAKKIFVPPQDINDYSYILVPIMRAVEYYIKQVFLSYGIRVRNGDVGKYSLNLRDIKNFSQSDFKNPLDYDRLLEIKDNHRNSIKICYDLIHDDRNPIVHADWTPDTSKVISSVDELASKVFECLKVFKECA